jgi:hypothetical protein
MWTEITKKKMRAIEAAVVRRGEFVIRLDALRLSSIDVAAESAPTPLMSVDLTSAPRSDFSGLNRLISSIISILHEAHIEEQGYLIKLRSDIEKCVRLNESIETIQLERDSMSPSAAENNTNSFGDNNDVDKSHDRKLLAEDNRSRQIQVHLRRWLQELHDKLNVVLDTKLIAHEVIGSTTVAFAKYLSITASESGISHSSARADIVVKPYQRSLLAHRFLETKEVAYQHKTRIKSC